MELSLAKACVLRVGGTNCDLEVKVSLEELGLRTDVLHMNQLAKRNLSDYQMLVFPGGFSYGDYVRAGAIWAREAYTRIRKDLEGFIKDDKLVLGICNGFQVLIETGMLPGEGKKVTGMPTAVLANNNSARYECRWVNIRVEKTKTPFVKGTPEGRVLKVPIGHGEGRLLLEDQDALTELVKGGMVVFRYAYSDGKAADGKYPENPNGAVYDIAGICSKKGNIMGMMPHPERAFFGWQLPNSDRVPSEHGDGRAIFEAAIEYIKSY